MGDDMTAVVFGQQQIFAMNQECKKKKEMQKKIRDTFS